MTFDSALLPFGNADVSMTAVYRAMFEQSLDAVVLLENEHFIDCNPAAERMYRVHRAELLGTDPAKFSPRTQADGQDSLALAREYVARANAGQPQRFRWLARRADGSCFPAEVGLSVLQGATHCWTIISVRDLSEEAALAEASARQSAHVAALLRHFPGGVSLMDGTGQLLAWNRALLEVLDLPDSLFDGGAPHIEQIFAYNAARGEYHEFGTSTEAQLAHLRGLLRAHQPYAYERTRPDGRIIDVRSQPVPGGGFVTMCMDVSEARRLSRAYQEQSVWLHAVLSHMPQGVSVFDQDLRLKLWNTGFLDVLEYRPEDVCEGVPFARLLRINAERGEYGPGEVEQQVASRLALAQRFLPHRFERTRPNGNTHLVEGKPVYAGETLCGFVTTYTDITDLTRTQQALADANARLERSVAERTSQLEVVQHDLLRNARLATLGGLVSGVTHELNTPIGNGLLIANTLRDHCAQLAERVAQGQLRRSDLEGFLHESQAACEILARSLQQAVQLMHSFKQVAADQTSLQRRSFSLALLCDDVLITLRSKLQRARVEVGVSIDPALQLESYPGALEQVLNNLIENALLHGFVAGQSGCRIEIDAQAEGEAHCLIRFTDNGAGVPEAARAHIFEQFFTTKPGQGGTGQGLHIVANLLRTQLGGSIALDTQHACGTCFVLCLPCVAPHAAHTTHSGSTDPA